MFDRLEDILIRYQQIMEELSDPSVVSDQKRFTALMKEQSDLTALVEKYKEYKQTRQTIDDSLEMLESENEEEMREMIKEELSLARSSISEIEQELKILLLPKDPLDEKNVIVEIRAGTGGEEAALFAAELYRMYMKYAESRRWKTELVDFSESGIGGFKEISFMIRGKGAYSRMKFESGVHRVQRVPATETQGRVHTSAAGVVVLPEAEELDVELNMSDVKKETFCASGPGGQCVNTTYSAVRLTHIPTGIVVSMQDQKSQIKNMEKAISILRTRLYEREYNKYMEELSSKRKTMVATGDRSEKVRTYNYPQSRVTDHRIGYTMYNLPAFMDGDIEDLIDALQLAENAEKLKESVG